jgi:hypothetical protein
MKLKPTDLIVALLAIAVAFGAGYFWSFQRYEPGTRFIAAWIRAGQHARTAYDPIAGGVISEDPVVVLPSADQSEWHLLIMGKQVAKSEQPVRDFLMELRLAAPLAHPYVRISVDDSVPMSTVMTALRLCRECGYEDVNLNGLAGHNYTLRESEQHSASYQ